MKPTQRTYGVDALEPRRLLATLVVNGGGGDDHISVRVDANFIYPVVNGVLIPQPVGLWDDIQINGLGGNDDILIKNTGEEPVDIFPGTGADLISICNYITFDPDDPPVQDLDQLSARVFVHAGTDATDDTLEIGDALDTGADTYDIDENPGPMRLVKPDLPGNESEEVWWGESNLNVTIFSNGADSTINVAANVSIAGTDESLTIEDSSGEDTLTFAGTIGNGNSFAHSSPNGVSDTVLLSGDVFAGNAALSFEFVDLLTISDPAATGTYRFTHHALEMIEGAQTVTIATGGATVGLSSTHATQGSTFEFSGLTFSDDVNVSAGGGDDTFTIDSSAFDGGRVTVGGGAGTDSLTLSDVGDTTDYAWRFTLGTLTKVTPAPLVTRLTAEFSSIQTATLDFNFGDNDFTSDGTYGGFTSLTVDGNGGADRFFVQPSATTALTLNGNLPISAPGDQVVLSAGGATGGTFTPGALGAGTYTFPGRDPINFTSIESFTQPPATPGAPDLAADDDTGVSNTDNITNRTLLTFGGAAPGGSLDVLLFRDGALVDNFVVSTTTWTRDLSFPSGDDTFAMTVAFESPTSGLRSATGSPTNVRVDTVVPPTPGLPDMEDASDTGISFTDNVTRDNTPTFAGTVPADDVVRLFANNVLVGQDTTTTAGSYSITSTALADGSQIIVARFEDLAGNASPAGAGLVTIIDTVAPAAPTAAPDLMAASDTGWSSTDNLTRDATPTFTGTAPGNHVVRLFDGAFDVGLVQLPLAVTTYTVTSAPLSDGEHLIRARFEDVAGNTSAVGPALSVTIDTVRPALTSAAFNFLTSQNVQFSFSEDVSGGIAVTNVALKDVTNNVNVPSASLALSYTPNTATVTFPGFAGGILTDADWEMKLNGDVTDAAGNHFLGTLLEFFFLNGDANRDRRVNLNDFNILAANFGQSNRDFSQGDFNYDGVVNLNDFNLLASRFGASVAPSRDPDDKAVV